MKKLLFTVSVIILLAAGCAKNSAKTDNKELVLATMGSFSGDNTNKLLMVDITESTDFKKYNTNADSVAKYVKEYRSVEIDDITYFVLEGDLLYDADEVSYWAHKSNLHVQGDQSQKLLGMIIGGDTIKWPDNYVIKYCVLKNSFGNPLNYNRVVSNMKTAVNDWEKVCNVKFSYMGGFDDAPNVTAIPNEVDFVVREINTGGSFIAKAFFPNSPRHERKLLIDRTYYSSGFNEIGVLRHELGHVLGFRHEHIRSGAPAECQGEPNVNTVDLTKYDPRSVMHYFCGGVGSKELIITASDSIGATKIYGKSRL